MTEIQKLQAFTWLQSSLFILLFVLLLLFQHHGQVWASGIAFALLAAYHFFIEYQLRSRNPQSSVSIALLIAFYLGLCTLVVWTTRGPDESSLWIVFFLPIITAASHFSFRTTLVTCFLAVVLFASHFPPRMYFQPEARSDELPELLGFGIMFLLVGTMVQNVSAQYRRQLDTTRHLNQQLLTHQQELQESLEQLKAAETSLRDKERLASLGELSAGIAHEIRNPLGIISSSAQLLEGEFEDRNTRQLIDIIQEEATRLNRLITDFLFFGRQLEPQLNPVDLVALMTHDLDSFKAIAANKGISLVFDTQCASCTARIDEAMIRQVLLNLLLNAVDASEQGDTVHVTLRRNGASCDIAVRDQGCGIPEENRSRIFDPFFTTKNNGTGLGLANTYKIVQSHGGALTLASDCQPGSTFIVALPAHG